jgi:GT2 family glycosyltransferase
MKIVFCLPGNEYSRPFFDSWLHLEEWMNKREDIEFIVSTAGGSNVSKVRERCVRPFREGSDHPKEPFYGEVDYDYIMWIDSDIAFEPPDFEKLLEKDCDIIGGLYKNAKGDFVCQIDDTIRAEAYTSIKEPVEVYWTGFGFVLMKKGILENIEPPWFQTAPIDTHDRKDVFATEDIFFCYRAREAGFKIYIAPDVVVKHYKPCII